MRFVDPVREADGAEELLFLLLPRSRVRPAVIVPGLTVCLWWSFFFVVASRGWGEKGRICRSGCCRVSDEDSSEGIVASCVAIFVLTLGGGGRMWLFGISSLLDDLSK